MPDYGSNIAALFGLPPTPAIVSGDDLAVNELAICLTTPAGALAEVGDTAHYVSIDVTEWLGADVDAATIADYEAQARAACAANPKIASVDVKLTFGDGALELTVDAAGANGPFSFVLRADDAGLIEILRGGA